MFLIGLGMQGRIYKPNGGDILDILGFVGDAGAGALYFLARIMDWEMSWRQTRQQITARRFSLLLAC